MWYCRRCVEVWQQFCGSAHRLPALQSRRGDLYILRRALFSAEAALLRLGRPVGGLRIVFQHSAVDYSKLSRAATGNKVQNSQQQRKGETATGDNNTIIIIIIVVVVVVKPLLTLYIYNILC